MKRIQISKSFWLILSLIMFLDTERLLNYFLVAAVVHEFGHLAAIWICGGHIRFFHLNAAGGLIRYYLPNPSAGREACIAMSGCLCGGILAVVASCTGHTLLSGASTVLTCFNLLPISFLDGGRVLSSLLGECVLLKMLENLTIGLLLCGGVVFAFRWNGFGLLIIALILILRKQSDLREKEIKGMI